MLIKRFEGASMAEVVRRIRAELGPDAIVLDHRTRPAARGWLGPRGSQVVEVTAAVDREHRPAPPGPARRGSDETWRPLQLTRALLQPLEDEIRAMRTEFEEKHALGIDPSLAREINELRRIAEHGRDRAGARPRAQVPASAEPFLRSGLAPELAVRLAEETERRIEDGQGAADARVATLADRLENRLAAPRIEDPPHQIVVGAPGVGKTTALAKEADRSRARRLKLLSADASGPESTGRLRRVALEMGLEFAQLEDPASFRRRLRNSERAETLFVDTAGFVASDAAGIAGLARLRDSMGPRVEIKLVLSVTTKESDLRAQIRAAVPLAPDSLVFTRLDETLDLANLVNVVLESDSPPLAWLGSGAAIAGGMNLPDARELARSVLEGNPK